MAGYESSIGSKRFSSNQFKEIDIPDESQYSKNEIESFQKKMAQISTEEFDQEMVSAREVKEMRKIGKERLNEGAKKRIEMLLEMTRTIRKVNINEIEFTLQSLKSSEAREAFIEVSKLNSTIETTFEIRRQFLARSIVSVAETNINEFLASNSFEDKLAFIDQLDEAFLSRLYEEYMLLVEECKSKYLIKNDQDAKEVVEDLKK